MEFDDSQLLRAFCEEGSQEAFATLARRHAGLLYHAARRQTGRADLAEEAAQNALAILARKAASLRPGPSLSAWLHRTVCFEASKLCRRERRHHDRMKRLPNPTLASSTSCLISDDWEKLTPHLDEALNELSEADRQVVLLKYFEGWTFEEMAGRLGGQAAAWRQRGSRALGRLRRRLARHGVVVPLAVLAAGLTPTFSQAAPAAVAASLAIAPAAAASSLSWTTLALHTLYTMNAKQVSIAVAVLLATLIPLGYQAAAVHRSRGRVAGLGATVARLHSQTRHVLNGPAAARWNGLPHAGSSSVPKGGAVRDGIDLREIARVAAEGRNADTLQLLEIRTQLDKLEAAALDGLLVEAETLDLSPDHRRALYQQILSTLRLKDPRLATLTGLRLAATMSGPEATSFWMNPLPNCLREWAQKDPAAARTWFDEQRKADGFQNKGLGDADLEGWMAAGLFTGMMWGGERVAGLALFETLDDRARAVALQRFGTSNASADDHAQILRLAAGITQPEIRTSALMGATLTLAKSDLTQTGAFIAQAGLPPADARKLLVAAAVAPLEITRDIDVAGRLEWLRVQAPPDQREKALGYFLGDAAFADAAGVRQKVDAEVARGASDTFLGAFIRNAAHRTTTLDVAVSYLPQLADPAERTRTLRELQQGHGEVARNAAIQAGVAVTELDAALQAR